MITAEFLLTSLIVVVAPGTGAIYTINAGLTGKWRVFAAIGCTLGILPHMAACILGLSALMHMSARVFTVMKTAGALYLLFLSWKMWREAGSLSLGGRGSEKRPFRIAAKAIVINLLNPKLTLFFFAFLPLFVSKESAVPTREMIGLSAVFMAMTFVVFLAYGMLASAVSGYLAKTSKAVKRIQRAFALMFAAFAAKLLASKA